MVAMRWSDEAAILKFMAELTPAQVAVVEWGAHATIERAISYEMLNPRRAIVARLVELGADVTSPARLQAAFELRGDALLAAVRTLVAFGHRFGDAVFVAAKYGTFDAANLILSADASDDLMNHKEKIDESGRTALDWARLRRDDERDAVVALMRALKYRTTRNLRIFPTEREEPRRLYFE